MFDLGEDEHGTWLWRPPGASMQKGKEPSIVSGNLAVQLITRGTWWTAMFSDEEAYALYVDITTPAEWHGDRVVMVDLDLDVVRSAGAEPEVHDEDEFAEHRVWLGYLPDVVEEAQAATAWVLKMLDAGEEPFSSVGWARLEAARALLANRQPFSDRAPRKRPGGSADS